MADRGRKKSHSGRHAADDGIIVALASGLSVRAAAEQSGVSERTIARRLADPTFREQVRLARAELVTQASGRLAGVMTGAVDALAALIADEDPGIRLRAAAKIVELALRANREDEQAAPARLEIAMVQPLEITDAERAAALAELHARMHSQFDDYPAENSPTENSPDCETDDVQPLRVE